MAKDNKKTDVKPAETASKTVQPVSVQPLSPFDEMQRDMERMFDAFFPRGWMRPMHLGWPSWGELKLPELKSPKIDILERDDVVIVHAEVPGIDKNDIEISVTDDTITIKGQSQQESKEDTDNYHRREISRGSFCRTLPLPSTVDNENAKASFKDGMLEITLPKLAKTKRKTVSID